MVKLKVFEDNVDSVMERKIKVIIIIIKARQNLYSLWKLILNLY